MNAKFSGGVACFAPVTLMVSQLLLGPAIAAEPDANLAMQLSNPVAALISVPMQLNYDQDIGPADAGDRWLLNVQPVVPFDLNQGWNLISRTILPIVRQEDIFPGAGTQTGIGDVVQSVFFSPKAPTASGWILGVGPVFLLPAVVGAGQHVGLEVDPIRRPTGQRGRRPAILVG
jgi:hypothetical protein